MSRTASLHFHALIPLKSSTNKFGANSCLPNLRLSNSRKSSIIRCSGLDNSQIQQFNLSVPFFALLSRTEALGISLAAFSILLPFLGRFLKGATPAIQATVPEDAEQVFLLSQDISDTIREDLAWGSYILLRNTNTISVLISIKNALCVHGYWNTPKDKNFSKTQAVNWFEEQIQRIGLYDLKDALYFPQSTDSELWEMLPKGTRSLLVLPVVQALNQGASMESMH